MHFRAKNVLAVAAFAAATLFGAAATASTNVALTTDGASFKSASSEIGVGNAAVMESDVISPAPTDWYGNGETGFIFGASDSNQALTIDLGQDYSLSSFGATFQGPDVVGSDRAVSGPFSVYTSLDNVTYTFAGTVGASGNGGVSLITIAPTLAEYVRYTFGPSSTQYGSFGGSRVSQVFANAVPEPETWALMLVGFGGLGVAMRYARRKQAVAAV